MKIGVDLDNTLVCYDNLFHRIAAEQSWIPASTPATKTEVKAAVLRNYDNATWTELQGLVYGERLCEAEPYPEALEFFKKCKNQGYITCIISHKTQYPAIGPQWNLRQAALDWLSCRGWLDEKLTGLHHGDIEFTDTREAKVAAIKRRNCAIFIDDLPEIFQETGFPEQTQRYLFDPNDSFSHWSDGVRVNSWLKFQKLIFLGR